MKTSNLFDKAEGQVSLDRLQGYAIAFVVIGVVLTIGLSILGGVQDEMYLTEDVYDEMHQPSTPFPTNVTVDKASESDFLRVSTGSETVTFYDSSAGSNTTLSEGTDYNAYYDSGNFEMLNSSALNDYDSTADELYFDYEAEVEDTKARQGAGSAMDGLTTITSWLPIIALVVVSAIIIGLVSMFRGSGASRGLA
ncbi:hypothetical protein SAMN05443574_1403 [Haloarcula vallismortis]|uniref:Uncharacterized protein n=2 Tax=Haloarcula vallismortis TaxID=28442 RepID=M0JER1_HALVA|nr:hypothetical protein [Haloarcula vallismortis]EMA06160.1 hypothetical protein C437_12256 [Haloarcula vallismortis ATCC 29715]SDX38069.1 hypothetical protein SAMN05443574_1403 [Haloarcula vallismortis]